MGGGLAGGGRGGGLTPNQSVETRTNYDVDVEFFGIVKIYNPVSESYFRKVIESGGGAQASLQGKKSTFDDPRRTALLAMNLWRRLN
jgi:hypothetical protein